MSKAAGLQLLLETFFFFLSNSFYLEPKFFYSGIFLIKCSLFKLQTNIDQIKFTQDRQNDCTNKLPRPEYYADKSRQKGHCQIKYSNLVIASGEY